MNSETDSTGSPRRETQERTALDWPQECGLGLEVAREIRVEVRRRRRRRLGLAAVAGLLVLCGYWLRVPPAGSPAPSRRSVANVVVPEFRILADGTRVDLRRGAEIAIDFSAPVRRVELVRGEAHFAVAKDPARPFVVMAEGVAVRAVGTAFVVERGGAGVAVVVAEGRVAVARAGEPAGASAVLAAGETVTVAPGDRQPPPAATLSAEALAQRLAWRVPRLEFSGAPLTEIVRLFAEQGGARLEIGDPALRELKVSGILRADNTGALLKLLAADYGIRGETQDGVIVLTRP
jgi:transmembrane sensor